MAEFAYWASTLTGILLFFYGALVIKAYWPRLNKKQTKAVRTLAFAIALAFAAAMVNTVYWQIVGQWFLQIGWVSVQDFRLIGSLLDPIFKGLAAYAGYLHLKALYENLDEREKKHWKIHLMPWYPNRPGLCKNLLGDRNGLNPNPK